MSNGGASSQETFESGGHMRVVQASAIFSLCLFSVSPCLAQQAVVVQSSNDQATVISQTCASLTVKVQDIHAALVPGVSVILLNQNNDLVALGTADDAGAFTFAGLSPGTYHLKLDGASLSSATATEIVLAAGETRQLDLVSTGPSTTTTIDVTATLNQVAQAQVEAQEKQRILGILPNYYVSYIWDAAPMTPKLKYRLAFRSIFDPVTLLVTAGIAGAEQAHKTFPGYEQGAEGYAKRFGSTYADTVVGTAIGRAILPSILHQDPRYFYQGSGTVRSRFFYAISAAFICRGDRGQMEPNYSWVLGSFAAAGLSNVYRTPSDRSAGMTFRNGLVVVGSSAVVNVWREFFSRGATPNVPGFANGKPPARSQSLAKQP